MKLIEDLQSYQPYNEQEEYDKAVMLRLLADPSQPNLFTRENEVAHFTASAWLLNKEHTKVLMIYHNLYNSWAWTGGHADGETDLLSVAIKEAQEETGVKDITPVQEEIFSIETLTVDGHVKRGKYVPSHLHLNVTYLLEADEAEVLRIKPDENSGVAWFTLEEALEKCTEPWMIKWVYTKLNNKLVKNHEIYLAGGCFWGVEKYISNIKGVLSTTVGYANGDTDHPTYEQVRYENSGHAETVKVVFDENVLSLEVLLKLFFRIIDPTAVDQQGEDIGHQYRTGIYHTDPADEAVIAKELEKLAIKVAQNEDKPLAIEACPLVHFYDAEEYHQDYLDKNPAGYCHVPLTEILWVKTIDPMNENLD